MKPRVRHRSHGFLLRVPTCCAAGGAKQLLCGALALWSLLAFTFAHAADGTAGATATVYAPMTVVATSALDFHSFAANAGGTVAVDPAGERSSTGTVTLATAGGAPAAATFDVTGEPGASYSITLPDDGTVSLEDGLGNSMAVTGFASVPAGTGTLTDGTQVVSVGGVLMVTGGQATGAYTGSFTMTVEYN